MFSLGAILTKQPVAIAGALRALLYVAVILGAVDLTAEQLAGIAVAAEAVLGLFTWAAVTPNVKAASSAADAAAAGYQAGLEAKHDPAP